MTAGRTPSGRPAGADRPSGPSGPSDPAGPAGRTERVPRYRSDLPSDDRPPEGRSALDRLLMEWERDRRRMIDEQLKGRDIVNPRVLEAMDRIPRHVFVDGPLASRAYSDCPLPIGFGQTISQPYIVALMTQILDPGPSDLVLEIGSGCGYQTAVLSRLAGEVLAVERLAPLRDKSLENLARIGVSNVTVRLGDGRLGWPERAPFKGILVAAYAERLPAALIGQLAPGGRLVIPVGPDYGQELVLAEKGPDGGLVKRAVSGCRFVPLI